MHLRWPALFACLVWGLLLLPHTAVGGGLTASPDQLRALYVQRLVKYVDWPDGIGPEPGEPFVVAAVDPAVFKHFFVQQVTSDRFKVVPWPAPDVHVLYLVGAPEREVAAILKRVAGKPVLTITQNSVHLGQGAMVNFVMQGGKLKLEINPAAAEAAGLSISSRLLQLARIYRGGEDG